MFAYRVKLDGLAEATRALERLAAFVRSAPVELGRQIEREAVSVLEQLTPRQHNERLGPRRGQPLYNQWGPINVRSGASFYRSTVRNAADRTGGGLAVLNALEKGARPHEIHPRLARALAWREGATIGLFRGRFLDVRGRTIDRSKARAGREGWVVRNFVRHPGHQPFAMVARSVAHLNLSVMPVLERQLLDTMVRIAMS